VWSGVAVDRFGCRRDICLSGWADAATGCTVLGSNRQATRTNRQTIGTNRQATGADQQTIGTGCQATGNIREIYPWDSAVANTRDTPVSRLH
jgi:hypothetical protein